ncbi:MAG: ribosomal-protein-alanine N-acetyltransferase [Gammaproteobacteria bacterium RIFCSPLOWO2_02_FULL_61_13]|nr:MAG: ribosomal-protein-alanine N-acetyltransferase [Gammaproteobacteria bacterium RIFCSPLOWO2_02_FULL_61_13]
MSAVLKSAAVAVRPMREPDLDHVLAIEKRCYEFPWSRAIFEDCLRVSYSCWLLEWEGVAAGHAVMSVAAGEAHILNLCIDPPLHRHGLGRFLLDRMLELAADHRAQVIFLEVRPSNLAAQRLYQGAGFNEVGVRRNYYPARVAREDAMIMARQFS